MEAFLDDWGLTLVTFIPLVGALVMMATPKEEESTHKTIALGTSLVAAVFGVLLLFNFDYGDGGTLQFVVDKEWINVINSRYIVGLDGMSLPLLILTLGVVPLCIIYSFGHFPEPHNPKTFLSLILVLETGMLGSFIAQDLILFFVFFEVVLLPMFFLIGVWGGDDRRYASLKFFLYTLFGSALMLISFLAVFFLADGTVAESATEFTEPRTFDMRALQPAQPLVSPATRSCGSSVACSSASVSRCRCSRSTPGCPTPTHRRPRWVPSSWLRSCSSSVPTASFVSPFPSCLKPPLPGRR